MLRLLGTKLRRLLPATLGDPTAVSSDSADAAAAAPHSRLFRHHFTKAISQASSVTHFLEQACGLSSEAALASANKIKFKTTEKPRAVVALFQDYGFSKPQIAKAFTRCPQILTISPDKILKPKLEFFHRLGLPEATFLMVLSAFPHMLLSSLKNTLEPNLMTLKSILGDDDKVNCALRRYVNLLRADLGRLLPPKLETLRNYGVTEHVIFTLVTIHPQALVLPAARFDEAFESAEKSGISPSSTLFAHALGVLAILPKTAWAKKLENYKSLGWSEEQVLEAFRRHPFCMAQSTELVKKKMEFFAEKLKWGPEYLSKRPVVLSLSFEKRILPRCLVLWILEAKGLMMRNVTPTHLRMVDKEFLKTYVTRYQSEVPEFAGAVNGGKLELGRLALESKEELEWSSLIQKYAR